MIHSLTKSWMPAAALSALMVTGCASLPGDDSTVSELVNENLTPTAQGIQHMVDMMGFESGNEALRFAEQFGVPSDWSGNHINNLYEFMQGRCGDMREGFGDLDDPKAQHRFLELMNDYAVDSLNIAARSSFEISPVDAVGNCNINGLSVTYTEPPKVGLGNR